jgi:hypothetical protein
MNEQYVLGCVVLCSNLLGLISKYRYKCRLDLVSVSCTRLQQDFASREKKKHREIG